MIAFFVSLAVVTAGGVWATESIDRPRRHALRRKLHQVGDAADPTTLDFKELSI